LTTGQEHALTNQRVGFVGLGDQGEPMAQRIVDTGYELTVFARRDVQVAPLVVRGAVRAPTMAELAARSDVLALRSSNS